MSDDWPDETDNPLCADDRNFYKVEKWTRDGTKVERMPKVSNIQASFPARLGEKGI